MSAKSKIMENRMEKKPLRKKLNDIIFNVARYTEVFLSIVIIGVIILLMIGLVFEMMQVSIGDMDSDYFTRFLSDALTLVVGVEFVKMLCKHTPETMVEVLMFATARQMVVEHLPTFETLVGVIAIGVLFAIRKYLFLTATDSGKMLDKF